MFYFGILAGYAILYWVAVVALFPIFLGGVAINAHRDKFSWCVFWTVIGAILIHVFGLFDIVGFVTTNWMWLIIGFAAYLLLSFPYARFVEWRRYLPKLYKIRDGEEAEMRRTMERNYRYQDRRSDTRDHMQENRQLTAAELAAIEAELKMSGFRDPIKARNYKAKFVGWMVWWPYKLLYRIVVQWVIEFAERIRDLFRYVVERLMYQLQKDSDRAFKKHIERKTRESAEVASQA